MLSFRSPISAYEAMASLTQEQMQEEIASWQTWIGSLIGDNRFDSTGQLMPEGKIVSAGGSVVTDGPYVELKEVLGGYIIVLASSIDEAVELSKGCPVLTHGGNIEVRPMVPMEF